MGDCAGLGLHAPSLFLGPRDVAFASTAFDRNLTATGCLSLSLPVPLRDYFPYKSAVLSFPVPLCLPVSVKETDYEQRRSQVRVLPSAP